MTQQKIGTFSKSTFFYLILGWTLILVLSGLLRRWAEEADCREIAYNEAVAASERDLAYHAWSAGVGGVYALEGKGSPSPNPFLHIDNRDLTTTDGQTLTLINPEYMMRIVWQEKPRAGAAGVHLVALNPINPVNQADEWETNALHRLAGGAAEVAEQVDLNGTPYFRMVRPMPAGESCRRCHEHLGSGSSQIAGAVSVSLNMSSLMEIHRFNLQQSAIAHLLVWMAGVLILFLIIRNNRREQVAQFSAQEATARAEGALDQIMQNTADGLSIIDRQLRIIRVNKQFCQIAGQTEENIVGKSCHEIFPCSHCDWHECPVHRVLMGESHLERDYDIPDPRTGAIPYRATFFPLRGTGGNVIGVIGQFKNIGDLRQRQQEKEDQIRFLQNVFDALPNPVFYKNAEGRYVIVNDAFFRHLNATREEIIGKTDFELFTLEQAETLREQDEELLAHPGVEMTETTLVVASGATREVLLSRSTLVGPQGDIQGIIGVYLDITSRKRAERALAESESRYRMLFESAADAFFIHGVNQPFLAVNETACTLLGFSRQELWVKTMAELGSPECRPDIAHHMQEMELQGQQVFEATLIRADGNPVPVEINNRQIEYQQKTVILSIVRDISQRKKAEEELKRLVNLLVASNDSLEELNAQISKRNEQLNREIADRRKAEAALAASEERYRLLVESAPSLVVVLHEEQIAFINRTGARLLGDDNPTRFIGGAFADYLQEAQRGRIVNVLKALKNNATSLDSLQVRLTRLNGEEVVVELSMIPTDYQGRPAIQLVGHDITGKLQAEEEKERLQEQLQQAQKLESIGRLAGGVAHDFNNILTGILGYADLLTDPDFDPKTMRETAGEIRRAAERASNITQQLLAFSRRQMIKPQSVNLNTIIGDSTKMLKRLIGEHIDLMIQPVTEECFVHLDVGQMEQVLVNLVVNARDAMPDGGMVMIQIDPVVLTESDCEDSQDRLPGSYARISITDTGVGMSEEELKHIFEPFFTTKEVGKGTGLGLSTVYGIIQQNNGFIEVESRLGIGTTFRIYLPRVSAVDPIPVKQEVEILPGGTETILVAEDEPMVRQLACRILERQGYRVLEAEDGKVALEVLEKYDGRLDLVLTDVIMPQMNGKQLIEKLSTLRQGFKILYMSGYTEDILGHHGVLDEKTHFIAKPFTIETLTYKVREVLDQG